MIVEAIVGVLLDVLTWVLEALPSFTVPPALTPESMAGAVDWLARALGQVDPYIDVQVLVVCLNAVLAAFVVALAVKGVRIVLSLFTGGGGSAA